MKIRCDYCDKQDAAVFCSADEAALCDNCDERVHRANKVAQRHHRFSLSSAGSPLCDICQERRALAFCQQDRAILCLECDYTIHVVNEQTKKHCRFLLTGVKLTPLSSLSSSDRISVERSASVSAENQTGEERRRRVEDKMECKTASLEEHASSSISEYLETLPGWHVEEFFDNLDDHFESYLC